MIQDHPKQEPEEEKECPACSSRNCEFDFDGTIACDECGFTFVPDLCEFRR